MRDWRWSSIRQAGVKRLAARAYLDSSYPRPYAGPMTFQTTAPLTHQSLHASNRQAREVVRHAQDWGIDLNPPYQRGSVWTLEQRINLVRSWLLGIPIPAIMVNDRTHQAWIDNNGSTHLDNSGAEWAIIDGKQRLETGIAWWESTFAVPASWFPAEHVERTEDTSDGPYVRYSGLSVIGQRIFTNRAMLPVIEAKVATISAEADLYLLVNMGGTAQTDDDLLNASLHSSEM